MSPIVILFWLSSVAYQIFKGESMRGINKTFWKTFLKKKSFRVLFSDIIISVNDTLEIY